MLLNYGSLVIIALISGYNLFFIFRKIDSSARFTRTLTGMATSFAASAAFGIVFTQTMSIHFFESMGLCLLFASVVGTLATLPFKKAKLFVQGLLTAWLGGLIGTALGTMLFADNKIILVTDTIFIIFIYLLQRFSEWQSQKEQQDQQKTKKPSQKAASQLDKKSSNIRVIVLATAVIVLGGIIGLQKDNMVTAQIGQPHTQTATYDEQNDLQLATIEVNSNHFVPNNTEFKSGTMIKAIFHVAASDDEGLTLQSNDLSIKAPLKQGDNIFLINKPQPGVYTFTVGDGLFECKFTVIADESADEAR